MMIFKNINGKEVSSGRGTFVAQPKDNPAMKTVGDLLVYGANKVYADSPGDYVSSELSPMMVLTTVLLQRYIHTIWFNIRMPPEPAGIYLHTPLNVKY